MRKTYTKSRGTQGRTVDTQRTPPRHASPSPVQLRRDPPKMHLRLNSGRNPVLERMGAAIPDSPGEKRRQSYRNSATIAGRPGQAQSDTQETEQQADSPRRIPSPRYKRTPTAQDAQRIDALVKKMQDQDVPLVEQQVDALIKTLDQNLALEGLYRVSGNEKQINAALATLAARKVARLDSPHDASGLLKRVFELRCFEGYKGDTLIPAGMQYDLLDLFKLANKDKALTKEEKTKVLRELAGWLINNLPAANKRVFLRILTHLKKVAQQSHLNKMDKRNLGIVFGPRLCAAPSENNPKVLLDYGDAFREMMEILLESPL